MPVSRPAREEKEPRLRPRNRDVGEPPLFFDGIRPFPECIVVWDRLITMSNPSMQKGVGRGDRGDLLETFSVKRVGECSKSPEFEIGESQAPRAKLGFEHMVFLCQVRTDVLVLMLNPAGDHGDQDLEDHHLSSGRSGVMISRRLAYTNLGCSMKSRRLIISTLRVKGLTPAEQF
jgi:hypothetical protein